MLGTLERNRDEDVQCQNCYAGVSITNDVSETAFSHVDHCARSGAGMGATMGQTIACLTDAFISTKANEEKAMKWAKSQEKKGNLCISLEEAVARKVAAMNIRAFF